MYNDFSQMSSGLIHYSTYQKNSAFYKHRSQNWARRNAKHVRNIKCMYMILKEKLSERGLPLPNEERNQCKTWVLHISKRNLARKIYREDCKKQVNEKEAIFAVDLESHVAPNAWL